MIHSLILKKGSLCFSKLKKQKSKLLKKKKHNLKQLKHNFKTFLK